ncbi:MAG TPA: CoA transferase [Methylomirabilota bacterium]|jgi:crotonobetainyl-CoA:carnitine CoA-transferase CaiB-like acyl-CoA transferase
MDPARPFAGVEVVEFGQFIAVPFCAQLLADGGAHVVKIESLEGDPVRQLSPLAPGETRHFISRNRGKHSLPLDLRHPRAREVIDRLLARADVVLTNFRPGLAAEMGLDAAALAPRFPRLIVGNVSAFGRHGPDAGLAGMDLVVQARSGLMASLGKIRDGVPATGEAPVADYICALALAFGIAAALLRRERTGRGGDVEVALFMAALLAQNNSLVRVTEVDGPVQAEALGRLRKLRAAGASFTEQSATIPSARTAGMLNVYFRTYPTEDDVIGIACVSPSLQRTLMETLGLTDEAHGGGIKEREALERHYTELGKRVEAQFAARTTAEWKRLFDERGLPAAAVRFAMEMFDDEQTRANGFLYDLPHPALGPVRVLAPPVKMDGDGFRPGAATPPFGSEARTLLKRAGFDDAEIDALVAAKVTRTGF